jgi:hypothetical protein
MINKKLIVVFAAVLACVCLVVVFASVFERYPFTKTLNTNTIILSSGQYVSTYYANFTDGEVKVGDFFMTIDNRLTQLPDSDITINIGHNGSNLELDSMVLRFKSPAIFAVYLNTNYPLDIPYTFSREHLDTYIITVEDFSWLGKSDGDAHFELILQNTANKSNNLQFSADISMHYKTLIQLTAVSAHVDADIKIPNGEPSN